MAKTFRMRNFGDITSPIDARGNIIYTDEEVRRMNEVFNRRRMNGNEREQMIAFVAAGNLLRACARDLEEHAAYTGNKALLKRVCTSIKTIAVRMANQIEVRQLGSIMAQTDNAKLTVSAEMHPAMVNIKLDDLLILCNQAMEQCGWSCTCTRDESKECQLRRVLELVPGVKETGKANARNDASRCPYRGMEMEVEDNG